MVRFSLRTSPRREPRIPGSRTEIETEFGTLDDSILQIGSASFHGRAPGSTLSFVGNGLVQAGITGNNYWAPVFLPAGAVIDFLGLYACDTNPSAHVTATLTGYPGLAAPGTTNFFSVSSAQLGGNGCGYWFQAPPSPPLVVNNDVRNGGLYGFCLTVAFMVAGYSGADPVMTKVPFFILLGVFGAACGIALALIGHLLWGLLRRKPPQSPTAAA